MRVCLGMLARSDKTKEPLLERVLDVVRPCFDGVEILFDGGYPVFDFAAERNRLIKTAERKGYDWMFMLDTDECMFPEDIASVRSLMTPESRFILLPRIEFARDFDHYDPRPYPDYQGRVFRLGIGYRFRHSVHEGLYRRFSPMSEKRRYGGVFSDATPIYHYGLVKTDAEMFLKDYNYQRIARGQVPVNELPDELRSLPRSWPWAELQVWEERHPLQDSRLG